MTNPQKRKGDEYERDVLRVLATRFPDAYRLKAGGERDRGDIGGIAGVTVQAKNQQRWSIPEWWRGTLTQTSAGHELPLLVCKVPGQPAEQSLACTDLATMTDLLAAWTDRLILDDIGRRLEAS